MTSLLGLQSLEQLLLCCEKSSLDLVLTNARTGCSNKAKLVVAAEQDAVTPAQLCLELSLLHQTQN